MQLIDAEYEAFKLWRPAGHQPGLEWNEIRIPDGSIDGIPSKATYGEYPLFLPAGAELPRTTRLLFEYGKSAKGCFNSEHFIRNQFAVLMLFEFKFPNNRLLCLYDNGTVHRSMGEGALDASAMNKGPSGKAKPQRNTTWKGQPQEIGTRGSEAIAKERGLWKAGMKKDDLIEVLSQCEDFKNEKPLLIRMYYARNAGPWSGKKGHVSKFGPKCHPELAYPIEATWCRSKRHTRRNCRRTIDSLRTNIVESFGLQSIPLLLIQKWFRKMRAYMYA